MMLLMLLEGRKKMQNLMSKSDVQVLKQCIAACKGCQSFDCAHCPMRVRPGRLLHLAESYETVIDQVDSMARGLRDIYS